MVGSDLLRYNENAVFNITDFETNGLHLSESLPWQISYCVATQKKIIKRVNRYIRWDNFEISNQLAAVTHFDRRKYLELAEDPEVVLKDYEEILFDTKFSGHNIIGYDSYILDNWRRRMGRKSDWSFLKDAIDTNCLVKAFQKQWTPDRKNMLAWQYKIVNYRERGLKSSLGFSCRMFDIDYNDREAHDAEYDVTKNHQVLNKLIWSMEI